MKRQAFGGGNGAFTLMEVIVAMAIIGVAFVALYGGMTYGYSVIRLSREDMRATQVLVEKMEAIRLYNWTQMNNDKFIPKEFTATYAPVGSTNTQGVIYHGTVKVEDCEISANYEDSMKKVTVELTWDSNNNKKAKHPHRRSLSTYVAEHGLHKQIY